MQVCYYRSHFFLLCYGWVSQYLFYYLLSSDQESLWNQCYYPWELGLLVLEGWYAAPFLIHFVLWAEDYVIAECSVLTSPLQMKNHCMLLFCCSHLSQKKQTNLSVLLKILSVNYRVRLLPADILIFFIPAYNMSMLGNVYPQQNFARCSPCGEVLNQPILYWLRLSLTTYFFFMWCDSWHMSLCLPSLRKFILFTLCAAVCLLC